MDCLTLDQEKIIFDALNKKAEAIDRMFKVRSKMGLETPRHIQNVLLAAYENDEAEPKAPFDLVRAIRNLMLYLILKEYTHPFSEPLLKTFGNVFENIEEENTDYFKYYKRKYYDKAIRTHRGTKWLETVFRALLNLAPELKLDPPAGPVPAYRAAAAAARRPPEQHAIPVAAAPMVLNLSELITYFTKMYKTYYNYKYDAVRPIQLARDAFRTFESSRDILEKVRQIMIAAIAIKCWVLSDGNPRTWEAQLRPFLNTLIRREDSTIEEKLKSAHTWLTEHSAKFETGDLPALYR